MIHHRKGLPLRLEPRDHLLGPDVGLDDLYRYATDYGFQLLRHPHFTKAPLAYLLEELVAANDLARLAC
jgi:hypothetical protein